MSLRTNNQVKDKSVKFPDFNKTYLYNLKKYYQMVNDDSDDNDGSSEAED